MIDPIRVIVHSPEDICVVNGLSMPTLGTLPDFQQASTLVKSFEVCNLPVRCARFIVRKQWFVTASDDMHIRTYNYNTMEKVELG